jgi:N-acetylmuramoyl-L-alanine amidase
VNFKKSLTMFQKPHMFQKSSLTRTCKHRYLSIFMRLTFLLLLLGSSPALHAAQPGSLSGKIICVDAGHGGTAKTDSYRQGPTGEREEWVNLRVAQLLKGMLEQKGATVIMTRTKDEFIPLVDRVKIALDNHADLFLSIHHNATADSTVNFPIIYYHGNASENMAGVALGKSIVKALSEQFYDTRPQASLVSDHTIFASGGAAVLRGTYGIPAVLAEASFFTNPKEETLLKDSLHNRKEAEAYLLALQNFFGESKKPILDRNSNASIPPFRGLQEADRMSAVARNWYRDYEAGVKLERSKDTVSLRKAYDLFTQSARSFPDAYIAQQIHEKRAVLLKKLGREEEAKQEALRAKEFYVKL